MAPSKTKLSQSRRELEVIKNIHYNLSSAVSFRVIHFCSFGFSATTFIIICKVIIFLYSTELSFVIKNIFIVQRGSTFLAHPEKLLTNIMLLNTHERCTEDYVTVPPYSSS